MKVRKVLGLGVAVPALVLALAQPSVAAQSHVVTFAGTIQITPTASGAPQTLEICFYAAVCQNFAEPSGVANGGSVDPLAPRVDVVDGLEATARFGEMCAPGGTLQPTASAILTGRFHQAQSGGWTNPVSATWLRAGLVAVIAGQAVGAAVVSPLGTAPCGSPIPVAVSGSVVVPVG